MLQFIRYGVRAISGFRVSRYSRSYNYNWFRKGHLPEKYGEPEQISPRALLSGVTDDDNAPLDDDGLKPWRIPTRRIGQLSGTGKVQ